MANEGIHQEIDLLRKQLEAMKKEREVKCASDEVTEQPDSEQENKLPEQLADIINAEQSEDLITQFKELLDSIDQDIKDTKPTTLLLVFAIGVLVGRL